MISARCRIGAPRAVVRECEGLRGGVRPGDVLFAQYVEETWFPNHPIELVTRQTYRGHLDLYILPEFGGTRLRAIRRPDVRAFVARLKDAGKSPALISGVFITLSAVFATALNDEIITAHPCKGVKTPTIPEREYTIVSPEQFDRLYWALPTPDTRLLVETAIESGMRWGELTELRVKDLDFRNGLVTVRRTVIDVNVRYRVNGVRFVVKDYPKGRKPRRFKLTGSIMAKIGAHLDAEHHRPDDLVFRYREPAGPVIPELPDLSMLGSTEPNANGRTYQHGTLTAYQMSGCKCEYCRAAYARYRAQRRAAGKDSPRRTRVVNTDGHIPRDYWRANIWLPALETADLGFHVRFHDLRHSHASWLLAGGADLQVVKERMGHRSIITTERYLHTLPEADETALEAFTKTRYGSAKPQTSEPPSRIEIPRPARPDPPRAVAVLQPSLWGD